MYGIERNFFLPFDTEIDSVTLASLIDRAQKYALPSATPFTLYVTFVSDSGGKRVLREKL